MCFETRCDWDAVREEEGDEDLLGKVVANFVVGEIILDED